MYETKFPKKFTMLRFVFQERSPLLSRFPGPYWSCNYLQSDPINTIGITICEKAIKPLSSSQSSEF